MKLTINVSLISCFLISILSISTWAQKPKADFQLSPAVGCAPLTVYFEDKSSNDAADWEWDVNNDGVYDYTGDPLPTHIYTSPGYYSVRLTVSNFTDSATITKTRIIRVTTPPSIRVSDISLCQGDTITLKSTITGGIRPFRYFWSSSDLFYSSTDSIAMFAPDSTRLWSLEVTDSVGCSVQSSFNVSVKPAPEKPILTHTPTSISCVSDAIRYQWYYNGTAVKGATQKTFSVDTNLIKSGYYQVEVSNSLGCNIKSDSLFVSDLSGVEGDDEFNGWSLYPNPVESELRIRCSRNVSCTAEIMIFSPVGLLLHQSRADARGPQTVIDASGLQSGVYMIQIREGSRNHLFKIMKR